MLQHEGLDPKNPSAILSRRGGKPSGSSGNPTPWQKTSQSSSECTLLLHKFQEHKSCGNTFRKVDDSPGTVGFLRQGLLKQQLMWGKHRLPRGYFSVWRAAQGWESAIDFNSAVLPKMTFVFEKDKPSQRQNASSSIINKKNLKIN